MLSWFEIEAFGEHIIDNIVQIVSFNELLSLVAWVHGRPTELMIFLVSLHEVPNWLPHHSHWLHAGKEKETSCLIDLDSRSEELPYIQLQYMQFMVIEVVQR